jgi:LysM repeat protein
MDENYNPEGFEYLIQAEDTLCDIADHFYLNEDDLIAANPEVDFEALEVGQVINIPEYGCEEQWEQASLQIPAYEQRPRHDRYDRSDRYDRRRRFCRWGREYRVRPGDTPYRIARRFGIPIRVLINRNRHINFNYPLQVGDILCV